MNSSLSGFVEYENDTWDFDEVIFYDSVQHFVESSAAFSLSSGVFDISARLLSSPDITASVASSGILADISAASSSCEAT